MVAVNEGKIKNPSGQPGQGDYRRFEWNSTNRSAPARRMLSGPRCGTSAP